MRSDGVCVCLVFYLVCPANIIGLWWAIGSPLVMDPNIICRKSRRLGGKQHEICKHEREIVDEVSNGAKMAIAECQFQFRNRRWNCTTANRAITRVLRTDTREAAFIYALTSAGVVYAVTQACSMGNLTQCSCDHTKLDKVLDGKWVWGGCNDDVRFGSRKAAEFMDPASHSQKDVKTIIHLHNNKAGRLAVRDHRQKVCKCHGLSGSCALQTCTLKMPSFRDIGLRLKEKFDSAYRVSVTNDGRGIIPHEDDDSIKGIQSDDLVYLDKSPNFCKPSKKRGSLGTKDRVCDPKSPLTNGCDIMCCGRGHRSFQIVVKENCKCQFKWCCKVECQTCIKTHTVHRCS